MQRLRLRLLRLLLVPLYVLLLWLLRLLLLLLLLRLLLLGLLLPLRLLRYTLGTRTAQAHEGAQSKHTRSTAQAHGRTLTSKWCVQRQACPLPPQCVCHARH